MSERTFLILCGAIAAFFTVLFAVLCVPPLVADPDIVSAFAAGFVNPFAAGFSSDVLCCWSVLAVWIVYEARAHAIRHGWICLALGVVPGVAVGFASYLILRTRQRRT